MRPLPNKFEELEDLLLNYRDTMAQNTGVPFIRLVYRPDEEVDCQRRHVSLERALRQKNIAVQVVSCRDIIFAYYEQRGLLDQLFEADKAGETRLAANITTHAQQTLEQQLSAATEQLGRDGVIFLVDTAFLYPYLPLTETLDTFTNRIEPPMALVVFYPGEVDLDNQLLFLGMRASGYYRTRDLI